MATSARQPLSHARRTLHALRARRPPPGGAAEGELPSIGEHLVALICELQDRLRRATDQHAQGVLRQALAQLHAALDNIEALGRPPRES